MRYRTPKAVLKHALTLALVLAISTGARASYDPKTGWTVNEHWLSGVPLGGVGAGKVEIYPDGWFGRATFNHNRDRPTKALAGALAVISASDGLKRTQRTLRMPAVKYGYVDRIPNVASVSFRGYFPSAELAFRDPNLPVKVDLHAWSSLVFGNAKDSSLPVAHLDYTVTNITKRLVTATLMLGWPNYLGYGISPDGTPWTLLSGNFQTTAEFGAAKGLLYMTAHRHANNRQNVLGQYFVGIVSPNDTLQQMPTFDPHACPVMYVLPERLFVDTPAARVSEPCGAVAMTVKLKPGDAKTIRFIVAWAMPYQWLSYRRAAGYTTGAAASVNTGAMVDGDRSTRWRTERAMLPGDAVEITLPDERALGTLALDSGLASDEYPHGYKVYADYDGSLRMEEQAVPSQATANVRDGVLTIDLRGITSKRIRITNTGLDPARYWSVSELHLSDLEGQAIPLKPAQVQIFESRTVYADDPERDVGHFWRNHFTDIEEITTYASANADRLWKSTREWQEPLLASNLPEWLQRYLVNSMYPAFSGTVFDGNKRLSILPGRKEMIKPSTTAPATWEELNNAYRESWLTGRNPWDSSRSFERAVQRLPSHLTTPLDWDILPTLAGLAVDTKNRRLTVAPVMPEGMRELHIPVYHPAFWLRVDVVPSARSLKITVLKVLAPTAAFNTLSGVPGSKPITLAAPLPVTTGAIWDLSPYWNALYGSGSPKL